MGQIAVTRHPQTDLARRAGHQAGHGGQHSGEAEGALGHATFEFGQVAAAFLVRFGLAARSGAGRRGTTRRRPRRNHRSAARRPGWPGRRCRSRETEVQQLLEPLVQDRSRGVGRQPGQQLAVGPSQEGDAVVHLLEQVGNLTAHVPGAVNGKATLAVLLLTRRERKPRTVRCADGRASGLVAPARGPRHAALSGRASHRPERAIRRVQAPVPGHTGVRRVIALDCGWRRKEERG